MLEPVQIRLPGFSALYRYTKFGMVSLWTPFLFFNAGQSGSETFGQSTQLD
jgi:hypothetical protein